MWAFNYELLGYFSFPLFVVEIKNCLFYKSKLELKSNSSELFPVNLQLKLTKLKLEVLKSNFQLMKERYEHR